MEEEEEGGPEFYECIGVCVLMSEALNLGTFWDDISHIVCIVDVRLIAICPTVCMLSFYHLKNNSSIMYITSLSSLLCGYPKTWNQKSIPQEYWVKSVYTRVEYGVCLPQIC